MILIPEKQVVVLLVPRTGTTALSRAIAARYPMAMRIYRHMEADGVPFGYDRWPKVGVIRSPYERLWSLYKYCRSHLRSNDKASRFPAYVAKMAASVAMPFNGWIVNNEVVFTNPFDSESGLGYYPNYAVRHGLPENRKSQFLYLRPDLGTSVFHYERLASLASYLDIDLSARCNESDGEPMPGIDGDAIRHIARFHDWDCDAHWRYMREAA